MFCKEMKAYSLSAKGKDIAEYYLNNEQLTHPDVAKMFGVSVSWVSKCLTAYFQRKMIEESKKGIQWDEHELDGELNEDHDFRMLIKYV